MLNNPLTQLIPSIHKLRKRRKSPITNGGHGCCCDSWTSLWEVGGEEEGRRREREREMVMTLMFNSSKRGSCKIGAIVLSVTYKHSSVNKWLIYG